MIPLGRKRRRRASQLRQRHARWLPCRAASAQPRISVLSCDKAASGGAQAACSLLSRQPGMHRRWREACGVTRGRAYSGVAHAFAVTPVSFLLTGSHAGRLTLCLLTTLHSQVQGRTT